MSLKSNINKVHFSIKESYQNTDIKEKSDKKFGNYFEINVLHENKNIKMILTKQDLEGNVFKWKYYSNPLDVNSYLVERISNVDNILEHVKDIFDKKRFDSEYLKK
jgi:hypothetical protein